LGLEINPKIDVSIPKVQLGTEYGGYWISTIGLDSESIVYSIGIGEDVSFDLDIIDRFGCMVYAFDPTPKSINWIRRRKLPEEFRFSPIGIAGHDGEAEFFPPRNPAYVSHSLVNHRETDFQPITVKVNRITTLMNLHNHTQIDLLKMDIEGGEYLVIKDILESDLRIMQVCLEFHHRFSDFQVKQTVEALQMLRDSGYAIFHWDTNSNTCSLIHRDFVDA
jgi:FkbM family methyltransferase